MSLALPAPIQKNLLDLEHSKQLQYFATALIILFTYTIGFLIAVLSGQINLTDPRQLTASAAVSLAVVLCTTLFIARTQVRMRAIVVQVKQLRV